MDYQKHYEQLISKHGSQDKPEGYSERHHILPKSMGGSDDASNLVYLSAKAHFVAHHLLWRWHRNRQMAFAFRTMCIMDKTGKRHKASCTSYQEAKLAFSLASSGENHPNYGKPFGDGGDYVRRGEDHPLYGTKRPDSVKHAISNKNKARWAEFDHPRSGAVLSEVTKAKIGIANKGHKRSQGLKNAMAKLAEIYCFKTNVVIATGVCIAPWAKSNGYDQATLSATARGVCKQHKGIYARYI